MDVERLAMFAGVGVALGVGAFVLWDPAPRPKRRGQVTGITNLGYTCFLNSLLQALAACPIFIAWLKEQGLKNKSNSCTRNLISLLDKINGYSEDLYGDIAPIEMIASLGSLWNFDPGHQDAHELFHVILTALQNETETPTRVNLFINHYFYKNCVDDVAYLVTVLLEIIKKKKTFFPYRNADCPMLCQQLHL